MQKTVETFANACAFTAEAQSALRQTAQRLERYPQSMRVFTACRKALFDGDETLWARLDALAEESGIHRFTVHQLFLIFCAGETAARYQEAGYAPALYWDTMKDLRCKMEETCQVYGVWGVCCGPFLANLLRMRCVCLGRLQFELLRSEFAFSLAGSSLRIGEPVVNVHIPSFGKLSYEAVTDSYRRAAEFFQQKFLLLAIQF